LEEQAVSACFFCVKKEKIRQK
jgi:hypothetical protein